MNKIKNDMVIKYLPSSILRTSSTVLILLCANRSVYLFKIKTNTYM